ncbi:uncharacterized protein LOC114972084 [Acropora millepora]|uniref:uncharacterized protein LOC114972084 n=1 Tax=Acropora millepora TaxID=45264 RepID=UPI001CF4A13D|nr:uncharacterized protein LOC114972084 [Acropora millepora]
MRAPKYLGIVIVAQVSKKSYLCSTVLMLLFIVLRGQATDLDTKCAKGQQISVFWWSHEPYISGSEEYHREERNNDEIHQKGLWGMFPVILARVLRHCCHVNTTLSYKKTHDGPESLDSILALNQFDVIIPVGAELQALTVRRFPFAVLLESPGVAVLIRGNVSGTQLLLSVLQGWPILVFILISASLAGVVIWLVERKDNYDQFPKTFLRGTFEGFWWAFITMTTVGYGDKAPRTILGKVLGVFWMLAGLIITTMFISIITASLASVSLQGRSDLRGVKVSVVNHSVEHKLGIREIANVKVLPNTAKVFQTVIDGHVEGALVDVHGLKHHFNSLIKHNIQVGSILKNHVGYGAILSWNSSVLLQCLQEYLEAEEQWLFYLLAEKTGTTQTKISVAEDYFGSGGIFSITVYSGLSLFLILMAAGFAWEIYKKKAKEQKKHCGPSEVTIQTASVKPDDGDIQPKPRLLLGQKPSEQLLSKQSMEVVTMDQELSNFQKNWQERFDAMLQRHQLEHDRQNIFSNVSEKS